MINKVFWFWLISQRGFLWDFPGSRRETNNKTEQSILTSVTGKPVWFLFSEHHYECRFSGNPGWSTGSVMLKAGQLTQTSHLFLFSGVWCHHWAKRLLGVAHRSAAAWLADSNVVSNKALTRCTCMLSSRVMRMLSLCASLAPPATT